MPIRLGCLEGYLYTPLGATDQPGRRESGVRQTPVLECPPTSNFPSPCLELFICKLGMVSVPAFAGQHEFKWVLVSSAHFQGWLLISTTKGSPWSRACETGDQGQSDVFLQASGRGRRTHKV